MKLQLLTTIAVLTTSFVAPVSAQNQPNLKTTQVLQACAEDKADTLPIPFTDLSPTDWAFKAVMSMYYCGAYRGSVPPQQVKPFLQPQSPPPPQPMS